jgi:hypothetical protein
MAKGDVVPLLHDESKELKEKRIWLAEHDTLLELLMFLNWTRGVRETR